jgi:serine/threonine protein kinase
VPQVLPEGHVLDGRYVIEARLGDGAMGAVYRAHHVNFNRQFAIKVLHKSLMSNAKVLERFEREAEMAGRLRHTNVASVVDIGLTDDGVQFMAMEFASGTTLMNLMIDGPMAESRVLDLVKQLCSGLQHAHDVGLLHRDFKPENVIVEHLAGGREVARIVDWGVAILREDAGGDVETARDRLTTKGIVVGTPHYMAPEQARGGSVDHRLDLFALGLICFELLTGKLPFDGSGVDIARANMESPTPRMRERNPDVRVDPVLEAIVRKLLEKDPEQRPATANGARELFELYERDRASCALLLGVNIPIEDRRTGTIEELADSDVTSEPDSIVPAPLSSDPERRVTTDEMPPQRGNRLPFVIASASIALACVLWLGLRGGTEPAAPPLIAALDGGEEIMLAETKRIGEPSLVEGPELPSAPAAGPSAKPAAKRPATGSATAKPAVEPPSASDVAKLYGATGRELKSLEQKKGMDSTIELWPRYRWIRINEWITTPERRAHVAAILERLRIDIRASY